MSARSVAKGIRVSEIPPPPPPPRRDVFLAPPPGSGFTRRPPLQSFSLNCPAIRAEPRRPGQWSSFRRSGCFGGGRSFEASSDASKDIDGRVCCCCRCCCCCCCVRFGQRLPRGRCRPRSKQQTHGNDSQHRRREGHRREIHAFHCPKLSSASPTPHSRGSVNQQW